MSQFKKKLTAFSAMLAFLSLSSAATFAMPGEVINQTGNTGIVNNGNRTDINITSGVNGAVGQIDWKGFNVGANQHVNFGFSGLSQTIINRVLGGHASEIAGKLTNSCIGDGSCASYATTSKVILINPAGIMFGAGSQVDLNSFTASTYDFQGAKNLKDVTNEAAYLSGLRKGVATDAKGQKYNFNSNLVFDSNYVDSFKAAGLNPEMGKTNITLEGATFDHFNSELNTNKSLAVVSDNITYKDSLVKIGDNYNYGGAGKNSFGNVKLVTADGVTFGYLQNGYINNQAVNKAGLGKDAADITANTAAVRNIDINNSGIADGTIAMKAGKIDIINDSKADGSNIKIANSIIKATKLINDEKGDIYIKGSKDVNVEHSRLETSNTGVIKPDSSQFDTTSQSGGKISILADKNVTVKDSLIMTAGSKNGGADSTAGNVSIYSYGGNANVEGSKVLAQGNASVSATDKANVNNSLVQASNLKLAPNSKNNVKISSAGGVNVHNSVVDASGDVNVLSAYTNGVLSGDVVLSSDLDENGQNKTLITAGDKLSVQGKNTKIDNGSLAYDEIHFYNDNTSGTNNVTVANNSTFSPRTVNSKGETVVAADVSLETNGDFTLDNATMQRAGRSLSFVRDEKGNVIDSGKIGAIDYNISITPANVNNLTVTSTEGNVNAINGTNVQATGNISLISNNADVNMDNAALNAGKDVNLTASKGALNIKNNSIANAGKDANLKAFETITFGAKDAENINIDNSSQISAAANINVTSLDGDINAEKTTMPTLTYGDRLKFDAKGNNNFTSEDSLKSVNVDYVAGGSNNFTTKGDIQFTNSSLDSKNNNITTTEEGGDVVLNNLEIKVATANAKDTVTKINAKGNVTNRDVTGTYENDSKATVHSFPQSVDVKFNVADAKNATGEALDVNNTKLVVNTSVAKDSDNPDNGSIVLDVKNANNKDAGIELSAVNSGGWDTVSTDHEGPEIHINATDNKLAVSKIVTDKLFTDANDKMYAADVALTPEELAGLPEGTPSKGYIEVRDWMGFNQDTDFNSDPTDFDYTGDYVPDKIATPDGDLDINKKHTINFGDTNEDFILVYDRPTGECPEVPDVVDPGEEDVIPEPGVADSLINQVKLPREQVEISKTSKVSDNTVDQTSNIMSAAAKVDLGQDAGTSNNNDDKDKESE